MRYFLPGIKTIEYAIADLVEIEADEKIMPGIPVRVFGTFTTICIEGLASLESETKRAGGQDIYTTTLTFRAGKQKVYPWSLETVLANKNIIYRLTDVNGKHWLMGTNNLPYPVAAVKASNPSETTGVNISTHEIIYTDLFTLLEII